MNNDAMLSFAASRNELSRVRWSTADAIALPFADGSFDLVVCQFGVMFFPDRSRAFREARRVLAAGGTYLFNVWDGLEHNDFARIVAGVAVATFADNPPLFTRRVPHGQGDCAAIERDLREHGFERIAWESVTLRSRAASAREAAHGICEGTPLRHEIMARDPRRLDEVVDGATRALQSAFGDGEIDGEMRAFVFTAR